MQTTYKQVLLLPAFKKFITASKTGNRLMPSGKKVRKGTIEQYNCVSLILTLYEQTLLKPLRICLLYKSTIRNVQKEKLYWSRFFKSFSSFMFKEKKYYDQYAGAVIKTLKAFFNYLIVEKCYPVGEFHKQFRIPTEDIMPIILTPVQVNYLISDKTFEASLSKPLQRTKDIFVFGCIVALRYSDLMQLKKDNVQFANEGVFIVLNTHKTGAIVKIPLPNCCVNIYTKYVKKAGKYVLPRLSGTNLNLQIKQLMKQAGWVHSLPKIRHRQGEPVEIKNANNESFKFYEHITVHTMRRTAITTLLLLGVDETSVRRISGHAPKSKEFYKYVGVVQDYLNEKVIAAHQKLIEL